VSGDGERPSRVIDHEGIADRVETYAGHSSVASNTAWTAAVRLWTSKRAKTFVRWL
jgi:hypothetical protein